MALKAFLVSASNIAMCLARWDIKVARYCTRPKNLHTSNEDLGVG